MRPRETFPLPTLQILLSTVQSSLADDCIVVMLALRASFARYTNLEQGVDWWCSGEKAGISKVNPDDVEAGLAVVDSDSSPSVV